MERADDEEGSSCAREEERKRRGQREEGSDQQGVASHLPMARRHIPQRGASSDCNQLGVGRDGRAVLGEGTWGVMEVREQLW